MPRGRGQPLWVIERVKADCCALWLIVLCVRFLAPVLLRVAAKIKEIPTAPVVDVRSPEEYSSGHLQGSKNINWNGDNFEGQILKRDKTKPVFVYCHSGRRSAAAANHMRSLAFKEVYELDGGISSWMQANLPKTTN